MGMHVDLRVIDDAMIAIAGDLSVQQQFEMMFLWDAPAKAGPVSPRCVCVHRVVCAVVQPVLVAAIVVHLVRVYHQGASISTNATQTATSI